MTGGPEWRPRADMDALRRRAGLLRAVRTFFAERDVLEVETPLLGACPTPDAHIDSLGVTTADGQPAGFLQFSPEFAMKRLLCAGSGPIYQIGKAFRGGERGRWHNPEFTMLEWYRPGFDHCALMDEVDALLECVSCGAIGAARRIRFDELFEQALGVRPSECGETRLIALATRCGTVGAESLGRIELLDALTVEALQPLLGEGAVFVHDYPPELAELSRLGVRGAERFELYIDGLEIANGYHELDDADECRRRMQTANARRRHQGKPQMPLDERFLAAMQAGLPASAGVALGLDRLLGRLLGADGLDDVLGFPRELA